MFFKMEISFCSLKWFCKYVCVYDEISWNLGLNLNDSQNRSWFYTRNIKDRQTFTQKIQMAFITQLTNFWQFYNYFIVFFIVVIKILLEKDKVWNWNPWFWLKERFSTFEALI